MPLDAVATLPEVGQVKLAALASAAGDAKTVPPPKSALSTGAHQLGRSLAPLIGSPLSTSTSTPLRARCERQSAG